MRGCISFARASYPVYPLMNWWVGHDPDSPVTITEMRMLTLAVGFQCIQLLARRDVQAGEFRGGVNLKQLAPRDALDAAKAGYRSAMKQHLGIRGGNACGVVRRYRLLLASTRSCETGEAETEKGDGAGFGNAVRGRSRTDVELRRAVSR
jgi:hypothetical protein